MLSKIGDGKVIFFTGCIFVPAFGEDGLDPINEYNENTTIITMPIDKIIRRILSTCKYHHRSQIFWHGKHRSCSHTFYVVLH